MKFTIVAGPANSGKSQRLCRQMVQAAKEKPSENFIAVVPEQFTLQMQQRTVALSESGAVMNIDIVSFNRLALKVFEELGINLNEVLDDTGKALVLRKVLIENANELKLYKNKVHMDGFIEKMKSVITELKTYGVSEEDLDKAYEAELYINPPLAEKLKDISIIYKKFNAEIEDIYSTSEEVSDIFAKNLYRSKRLKGAYIYLDGFTGFTPVQYRIIEGMFSVCKEVTCAITAPREALTGNCPETSLFYLANETARRLTDLASLSNIKTEIISYEPLSEQMAEKALVNSAGGSRAEIFEYEGKNKKEEAFFAAEQITDLVRSEGLRYREIAVITTDMQGYYPYLEQAFEQYGIPAFIDHKAAVKSNCFSRYVLCALKIVKERFSYESIFSYLKCGLSDLNPDEICTLENYCIEFGIKGPITWSRPFEKNRTLKGGEKAWNPEEINILREKVIAQLSGFVSRAKRAKTAAEYKEAFDRLFETNNIEKKLEEISKEFSSEGKLKEAGEYEQIYKIITQLLDKARVLTKNTFVSLDEYTDIIKSGIREIKIGLIPATLDMVTAGDLERSRLNKIKALFILGANEGSLPKEASGGGILSERDRAALKGLELEIAPSPMENYYTQRYYLYLMLNKPKKYLYLCRPVMGDDGTALTRSGVFDELSEYIPGCTKSPVCITKVNHFYEEESGLEELSGQICAFAAGKEDAVNMSLLKYFCEKRPAEVSKIIESAFYVNKESRLDKRLSAALYGDVLCGSVSRFESFNECAFRHFLNYGLGISPRPEYEVKAAFLGTIYHSALEKYVHYVQNSGFNLREITDEQSHPVARAAAAQAISEEESHIFESSARNLYQADRTIEVVVKTTDIIRQQIKEGKYDVAAVEEHFRCALSDGNIFSGVIDRIDIYDTGSDIYVNIVDYKTGSKEFSLREMIYGTQLQLPVYLDFAVDIIKTKNPKKDVHPAGVYYFLVKDEFEREEKKNASDTHIKGVFEEEDRMRALMDYAQVKLEETGEKIKSGEVSPSPLKKTGGQLPCKYCDYKDICRFKEGDFAAKARKAKEIKRNEAEAEIYG